MTKQPAEDAVEQPVGAESPPAAKKSKKASRGESAEDKVPAKKAKTSPPAVPAEEEAVEPVEEVELEDDSEEIEPEDEEPAVIPENPPVALEPKEETPEKKKRVIGATATIMEKKSELLFRARVDSGAKSCSLHIEDMKIENESEQMADNIGKVIRFNIKNGHNESHWLESKIAGYVIIKTSNDSGDRKRRYKVPLTFRWKDFEKTVLVTLNNRDHMEFPLLLGRNFLSSDFLVDVDLESND